MGKKVHFDLAAEQEAIKIGEKFMHSNDVAKDMGQAYGVDLSSVRIHTDSGAAQKTAERGVDAFSTGSDIFFGKDVFNQNAPASRGLLAHELSHSLQQGVGGEAGMAESAPMGAEQGGFLDWFKGLFKKKPEPEEAPLEISAPISVSRNESPESIAYMNAIRQAHLHLPAADPTKTVAQVPNRIPQAHVGHIIQNEREGLQNALNEAIPVANQQDTVSGSLVKLGLRTSSAKPAKADKAFRGTLMRNLPIEIADYFGNLEKGGMDISTIAQGAETNRVSKTSPAKYTTGGQMDQVNSDLLSMFSTYATSEHGISYIAQMIDMVGGADIFKEGKSDPMKLIMQTMLTSAGNQAVSARNNENKYRDGQDVLNVSNLATQTLLALPTLAEVQGEAKEALPENIKSLVTQYQSLIAQIREKIANG